MLWYFYAYFLVCFKLFIKIFMLHVFFSQAWLFFSFIFQTPPCYYLYDIFTTAFFSITSHILYFFNESFTLQKNSCTICTISLLHHLQPQIHVTGLLDHVFLRYTARTMSYYNIFNFVRQWQIIFLRNDTIILKHQKYLTIPQTLLLCQHLILSNV